MPKVRLPSLTTRLFLSRFDGNFALLLLYCAFTWWISLYLYGLHKTGGGFFVRPSGQLFHDFAYFWGGAKLYWLGNAGVIFHPDRFNAWLGTQLFPGSMQQFATWSYPPTMLLLLLPFGLLPLWAAFFAWLMVTFGLLAAVLFRICDDKRVVVAVLISPASLYCLPFGQNGALTGFLIVFAVFLADEHPWLSGAAIGLLIAKPQLGIIFPFVFLAGKRWPNFLSASLVSIVMISMTLLLFGAGAWFDFFSYTAPAMTAQLVHRYWIPPQLEMLTTWATLRGWGGSISIASTGQALSTLIAVGLAVGIWRRPNIDVRWRNALTCILPMLATPFAYTYDAIPVALAIALLAEAGFTQGFTWLERITLALLWIWPAVAPQWILLLGLPPIGACLLLALAACLLIRLGSASARNVRHSPCLNLAEAGSL